MWFHRTASTPVQPIAIRPATTLLAERQEMVRAIIQALADNEEPYPFVEPLLENCAGFVQVLPLTPQLPTLTALDYGLRLAATALTETVPAGDYASDPVWRYALLSSALIRSAGAAATGQEVMLVKGSSRPLARWNPLAGPMTAVAGARRFSARFRPEPPLPALNALLCQWLLPEKALAPLMREDVLDPWLETLMQPASDSPLGHWLAQAEHRLGLLSEASTVTLRGGIPEKVASFNAAVERSAILETGAPLGNALTAPLPSLTVGSPDNPGWAFVQWLRDQLATGALDVNKPRALVHVTPDGVVLTTPTLFKRHSGVDWQTTQRRFLKLRLHRKHAGGSDFLTFRLGQGEPFKAILLPEASLLFGDAAPPPNAYLHSTEH